MPGMSGEVADVVELHDLMAVVAVVLAQHAYASGRYAELDQASGIDGHANPCRDKESGRTAMGHDYLILSGRLLNALHRAIRSLSEIHPRLSAVHAFVVTQTLAELRQRYAALIKPRLRFTLCLPIRFLAQIAVDRQAGSEFADDDLRSSPRAEQIRRVDINGATGELSGKSVCDRLGMLDASIRQIGVEPPTHYTVNMMCGLRMGNYVDVLQWKAPSDSEYQPDSEYQRPDTLVWDPGVRIGRWPVAHLVQAYALLRVEGPASRAEVVVKLLGSAGADDRCRDARCVE
jgi:hypothetical protein